MTKPTIDIRKNTAGLSPTWAGYLSDWDRGSTALNKHKSLQQFFKGSPSTKRRSAAHRWTGSASPRHPLRNQALIRLFYNAAVRLGEIGNLMLDDLAR